MRGEQEGNGGLDHRSQICPKMGNLWGVCVDPSLSFFLSAWSHYSIHYFDPFAHIIQTEFAKEAVRLALAPGSSSPKFLFIAHPLSSFADSYYRLIFLITFESLFYRAIKSCYKWSLYSFIPKTLKGPRLLLWCIFGFYFLQIPGILTPSES